MSILLYTFPASARLKDFSELKDNCGTYCYTENSGPSDFVAYCLETYCYDSFEENEYKNYFAISCEDFKPGESLQFKLGFYIDEKTAKNDDMILSIGLSDKRKYGIKLKISEVING